MSDYTSLDEYIRCSELGCKDATSLITWIANNINNMKLTPNNTLTDITLTSIQLSEFTYFIKLSKSQNPDIH